MVRKRNSQRSSCPEGWLKDGIKLPVQPDGTSQEQYAARAVGIARSVFNLMAATHQMARAQGHGYWGNLARAQVHGLLAQSPGAGEAVQRTEA